MGNSVDVVIPIYKAGNDFVKMLEKLYKQSKRPEHIYLLQTIESKRRKAVCKRKMQSRTCKYNICSSDKKV